MKKNIKIKDVIYLNVIMFVSAFSLNIYFENQNSKIKLNNCYQTSKNINYSFENSDQMEIVKTSVISDCNDTLIDYLNTLESQIVNMYPIGSIYTSVTLNTTSAVSEALGGTWEVYGEGKVLVGLDAKDTDFDNITDTGGEKAHTLLVSEMPRHRHIVNTQPFYSAELTTGGSYLAERSTTIGATLHPVTSTAVGGDGAHNNLQPYVVVYMYKRIA